MDNKKTECLYNQVFCLFAVRPAEHISNPGKCTIKKRYGLADTYEEYGLLMTGSVYSRLFISAGVIGRHVPERISYTLLHACSTDGLCVVTMQVRG